LAEDVETLLSSKSRVLAALSDTREILHLASSAAKGKGSGGGRGKLDKAAKKIWFFL